MLDIRVIRENPSAVQEGLKLRGGEHSKLVDAVLACDEARRKSETEKQVLQNQRKTISKQIGMLKAKGEDTSPIEAEVRNINEQIAAHDVTAENAAAKQNDLLLNLPNLTHDACPVGSAESASPVVREWGGKPDISEPKDHVELALQHGLHYRVIELCAGDIGFSSAKTYDIEVWAPGHGKYLEVSSCSCFTDYQARRMKIRFKDAEGKNRFPHTLNGSGTALPRLYDALLEQYPQPDGSILIPDELVAYFRAEFIG